MDNLNELKPWTRNPRAIASEAAEGLKKSLHEFGDLSGIVYNTQLQALVSGHQRIEALIKQYGGQLQIVNADTPNGIQSWILVLSTQETFAIRYVDWDEAKHKAANIVANNHCITGTFTDELEILLREIKLIFTMFDNCTTGMPFFL